MSRWVGDVLFVDKDDLISLEDPEYARLIVGSLSENNRKLKNVLYNIIQLDDLDKIRVFAKHALDRLSPGWDSNE